MANTPDKVINIALKENGYLEKSKLAYQKNHNIIYEKTAGAGKDNYTKYGKEMHDVYPQIMDFPAYWCDAFVDWCFYKAYGVATAKSLLGGNFDDYTVASAQMYNNKGSLDTTPAYGSQVFFTKNGKVSGCYHTGLVYKVDSTYFYTVEGNTSVGGSVVSNGGGVALKKYKISSYRGRVLFGHPRYDEASVIIDGKQVLTVAKPTLRNGSKGTQVKYLQRDLSFILKISLVVDGDMGPKTITALKTFQRKYGLVVDGIYGNNSYNKMKSLLG